MKKIITIKVALVAFMMLSISFLSNAQLSNKLIEKAAKAKAGATSVEVEGDMGKVLVYATAERKEAITDITGLKKIYCTAYPHSKAAKKASNVTRSKYGLWAGSDCNLNGGTSCKDFFTEGGEIEANNWTKQAQVDFEIDMVEATEWEIKNGVLENKPFYAILDGGTNNKVRLAVSDQLLFDMKKSASSFSDVAVEKNKDLKMKAAAFQDAELEAAVRKVFGQRQGISDITRVHFTSAWNVDRAANGDAIRRSCKVNLSCKEDGKCKYYWFQVWEEHEGGGKYQLPYDKNDSFNRFNSELVPCENL